ncbi:MAG: protein kinase [Candidatus Obscuribacterales bacterium]|nr:protein kinase [Candidatus Obscuribacterales bacterium]
MDSGSNTNSNHEHVVGDLPAGTVVCDKFEILGFIAAGGKGRVYKAHDRNRNSTVALKFLMSDIRNEKAFLRFQSEARTSSKLNHPNIVTVYDFGLSDGTPYLSMEYVDGQSLECILETTKTITMELFCDIFLQISDVLAHAKNHGVIHRDLKPANIILYREIDGYWTAKVLDFGVAKRIYEQSAEEGRLTPTGDIVGSPLYMSPEQSQSGPITPNTDLYSLGCIMWQCLTGAPPFQGSSAMDTILMHQKVQPLKLHDVLKIKEPSPCMEALFVMIGRLLSKEPSDRPDLEESVIPVLSNLANELAEDAAEQERTRRLAEQEEMLPIWTRVTGANRSTSAFRKNIVLYLVVALVAIVGWFSIEYCIKTFEKIPDTYPDKISSYQAIPVMYEESDAERKTDQYKESTIENASASNSFKLPCIADNDALKRIAKIQPELQKLCIADSSTINDSAFALLAAFPKLLSLDLSRTKVKTLAGIEKLRSLEVLELNTTDINDASLLRLKDLNQLVSVILSNCSITDKGVATISHLKQIASLDLGRTDITDASIPHLLKLEDLEVVRITDNHLSIDAVRKLAQLPRVYSISVDRCGFSDKELGKLKSDFPTCKFEPNPDSLVEEEFKLGHEAHVKQLYGEAFSHFKKCVQYISTKPKINQNRVAYYQSLGATAALLPKQDAVAEKYLALAANLAARQGDDTTVYGSLNSLVEMKKRKGYSEGLGHLCDRLLKYADLAATDSSKVATFATVAEIYWKGGQIGKAAQLYDRVVAIRQKLFPEPTVDSGSFCLRSADCWRQAKKPTKALLRYDDAIKQFEPLVDREEVRAQTVNCLIGKSYAESDRGHLKQALKYNDDATKMGTSLRIPKLRLGLLNQRIALMSALNRDSEIPSLTRELEALKLKLGAAKS